MLNLNKCAETKAKPKQTLIFKNSSRVCVSLCTTSYPTQHRTALIIFLLIVQTISIAQMTSTGGEGRRGEGLRIHLMLDGMGLCYGCIKIRLQIHLWLKSGVTIFQTAEIPNFSGNTMNNRFYIRSRYRRYSFLTVNATYCCTSPLFTV